MPGLVGAPAHLAEQRFPLMTRETLIFEISARPLAAMVEKSDVIVLTLERFDFALDEVVEFFEIGLYVRRNAEIHVQCPPAKSCEASSMPRSGAKVLTARTRVS